MFSIACLMGWEGARYVEWHGRLRPEGDGSLSAVAFCPTADAALLLLSPVSEPTTTAQVLSTLISEQWGRSRRARDGRKPGFRALVGEVSRGPVMDHIGMP